MSSAQMSTFAEKNIYYEECRLLGYDAVWPMLEESAK
jgi:hypothetical protein